MSREFWGKHENIGNVGNIGIKSGKQGRREYWKEEHTKALIPVFPLSFLPRLGS